MRGWRAGVNITTGSGKTDTFNIAMTHGSSGSEGNTLIGTVTDTPDGPRFELSDAAWQAEFERRVLLKAAQDAEAGPASAWHGGA